MVGQLQRRRGALVAIVGALLEPHLPGGDDRHLGHREDGVGEDQQEDEEDFGSDGQFYDEPLGRRSIGQTRRSPADGRTGGPRPRPRPVSTMLTLTHVRKRYGSLTAVDDLSLAVRRGEVLGLLGPNGAGKSTTVSLAVGLLAARRRRGRHRRAGLARRTPRCGHASGVAPQALAVYDLLTGEENLRFFGEVYGLSGAALGRRVAECLSFVGLSERARDRAADLLRRHEAAAQPGGGPRARARPAAARRAHGGRRPAVAERHLRQHRGAATATA